jgi:glyoxylase-like metal-dependent hydrolase (beta-lactamase superfamily II)
MEHGRALFADDIEVAVVCQGWAPLDLADECPGHEVDWGRERDEFPWAFAEDDRWRWHVHGFVVRTPSGVTMVDTGLGDHPPYAPWPPGEGLRAGEAYGRAMVDPSEVTTVVLTHVHPDHAGGIGDGSHPRFPNARHVLHEADWAFLHRDDLDEYSVLARADFDHLHELGMMDLDPADREVAPGIRVVHTPGHTPGHRSVEVDSGRGTVLLTGDLLHLPIQVAHPTWNSGHDEDPELGARSRDATLERAGREGWTIGVPHFALPFGLVVDGRWRAR